MGETPKEKKDRTAITVAIITGAFGCITTVLAAFIGLLPALVSGIGQMMNAPTLTAHARAPTSVVTSTATDTLATFILVNNFEKNQDFYVYDNLVTTVDTGKYVVLRVPQGAHKLQNCLRGTNPQSNPSDCNVKTENVRTNPFYWEIFGGVVATGEVEVIFINNARINVDVFVDGQLSATVDSGKYGTARVARGSHSFQNCQRGKNPRDNSADCGVKQNIELQKATFVWTITD